MGIFVYLLTNFIISVIISFIHGWKLTLVVLCCAPVEIFAQALVAKVIIKFHYIYIPLSSTCMAACLYICAHVQISFILPVNVTSPWIISTFAHWFNFFIIQYKKKIKYVSAYKLMPSLWKYQCQCWNYYTFTFFLFYYKLWIRYDKNISFLLHCVVIYEGHYHHTHLKRLTFNGSCINSIWYVNTCSIC
jgi:hypothetical protein